MRKIARSSKTLCAATFRACAEARSRPKGFSTMTRACFARPLLPRPSITVVNSEGGIAR